VKLVERRPTTTAQTRDGCRCPLLTLHSATTTTAGGGGGASHLTMWRRRWCIPVIAAVTTVSLYIPVLVSAWGLAKFGHGKAKNATRSAASFSILQCMPTLSCLLTWYRNIFPHPPLSCSVLVQVHVQPNELHSLVVRRPYVLGTVMVSTHFPTPT
jgi:hypothetical protein